MSRAATKIYAKFDNDREFKPSLPDCSLARMGSHGGDANAMIYRELQVSRNASC